MPNSAVVVSTCCSVIASERNGVSKRVRGNVVWQARQTAFQWPSTVDTDWFGGCRTTALRGAQRSSAIR